MYFFLLQSFCEVFPPETILIHFNNDTFEEADACHSGNQWIKPFLLETGGIYNQRALNHSHCKIKRQFYSETLLHAYLETQTTQDKEQFETLSVTALISPSIWGSTLEPQFGLAQLRSTLVLRLWTKISSTNRCPVSSSKTQHFLLNSSQCGGRMKWHTPRAHVTRHGANTQPRAGPSPAQGTSLTDDPS